MTQSAQVRTDGRKRHELDAVEFLASWPLSHKSGRKSDLHRSTWESSPTGKREHGANDSGSLSPSVCLVRLAHAQGASMKPRMAAMVCILASELRLWVGLHAFYGSGPDKGFRGIGVVRSFL